MPIHCALNVAAGTGRVIQIASEIADVYRGKADALQRFANQPHTNIAVVRAVRRDDHW